MATTGDKVRARCVVIPIETCDEGFEHIDSVIGKRLGGACDYSLLDTSEGDHFFYDEEKECGTTPGDLISGTYTDGGDVHVDDIIQFLYVKNLSSTQEVVISLDANEMPAAQQDSIKLRYNQTAMVPLNSTKVSDVHVYATATINVEVFAVIRDVA